MLTVNSQPSASGIYHVVGEIVVVHEITLAAAVTNLKRIILEISLQEF
jgi:hypothetical protein